MALVGPLSLLHLSNTKQRSSERERERERWRDDPPPFNLEDVIPLTRHMAFYTHLNCVAKHICQYNAPFGTGHFIFESIVLFHKANKLVIQKSLQALWMAI